jgi:hypothetical protein
MTDASHTPQQVLRDPNAEPSDDAAELAEHHEHAIVNRRLDEDAV